jgi:hypothetical protein
MAGEMNNGLRAFNDKERQNVVVPQMRRGTSRRLQF